MPEDPLTNGDAPVIKVTVASVLQEIQKKLDHIDEKLDTKAEAHVVSQIQGEVDLLKSAEAKRTAVEAALAAAGRTALAERHWRWPVVLSSGGLLVGALEVYFAIRIH